MITFLYSAAALVFHFGFEHPFRMPKMLVLTVLLCVLAYRNRPTSRLDWVGVSLFGWPLVAVWWVVNPILFFGAVSVWALYLQAITTASPLPEREGDAIREGLAWSGSAVAVYCLAQRLGLDFVSIDPADSGGGFFGNPNFAAHFMLLGIGLGKWRKKSFYRIGTGLLIAGILVSQSRGAWLGLVLYGILRRDLLPNRIAKAFPLILGLSLLLIAAIFFRDLSRGWHYLRHPLDYVAAYQKEPEKPEHRSPWFRGKRLSLMTRWILYRNSIEMAKIHGFRGVGPGQFHVHYPKFSQAGIPDINLNRRYRAVSAHNLPLDATIQLGLPWLLLAGWWLWRRYRQTNEDKIFWATVAVQGCIAMFSLNYLNPVIVTTLILLAPRPVHASSSKARSGTLIAVALTGFIALVGWMDYRAGQAHSAKDLRKLAPWLPEAKARLLVEEGDWNAAWHAQHHAFQFDPYGPETIFNMGLVAWVLGGREQDAGLQRLAIRAFLVNRRMHPFYEPAAARLKEIETEAVLDPMLPAVDGGDYRTFRRMLEREHLRRAR